jgi:hypothetical protein
MISYYTLNITIVMPYASLIFFFLQLTLQVAQNFTSEMFSFSLSCVNSVRYYLLEHFSWLISLKMERYSAKEVTLLLHDYNCENCLD